MAWADDQKKRPAGAGRFDSIELIDTTGVYSSFIKGYEHLPVRITA